MKIYIVERDNPKEWIEPEVFADGKKALDIVRKEYETQMSELGTSQEKADKGFGNYGCYWQFEEDSCVGSACIDSDCDCDQWKWRITEHEIEK